MSHQPKQHVVPACPSVAVNRRSFLRAGASLTATATLPVIAPTASAKTPPRTPTAVRTGKQYDYAQIRSLLGTMLDEIGGVRPLVKQKFVTIKTNLVNSPVHTWGGLPVWLTTTTHPAVAMALGSLLVEYGARRVTFCDQLPYQDLSPEVFRQYGYDLSEFNQAMDGRCRFANTRNRGDHSDYALVRVPEGGFLANAWEVNRTYADTDVLVSLTKLKSHISGGVTLGMKNLYGVPPSSLYGDDLVDEPDESATGYRGKAMHNCVRKPFTSVDTFTGKSIEGDHGFNVPHFILDLNRAFPIELVVIDGISTIANGEGAWMGSRVEVCRPNLLIAGRNPVCTDAVAASLMGFHPDAPDEHQPFINGVNYLRKARELGMGENRIDQLDVVGEPLSKARWHFPPTFRFSA